LKHALIVPNCFTATACDEFRLRPRLNNP
jgi:hypothetical protein